MDFIRIIVTEPIVNNIGNDTPKLIGIFNHANGKKDIIIPNPKPWKNQLL